MIELNYNTHTHLLSKESLAKTVFKLAALQLNKNAPQNVQNIAPVSKIAFG